MISMYIPVLGPGWAPAVLETFQEIDFLREAQQPSFLNFGSRVNHLQPYYITSTVDLNRDRFGNHFDATPSGNFSNDRSLNHLFDSKVMLNIISRIE